MNEAPAKTRDDAASRALVELGDEMRRQARGKVPGVRVTTADELVQFELERIAGRVRRWREEADLTLLKLARRSGVAASTIQKIESMQMVPTIGVLLKIARGLERSLSELVRDADEELAVAHLRAEERHPVGIRSHMVIERLVGDLFESTLEVWRITLPPGSGSGRGLVRHDGETLYIVEEGELTCRVGDREYRVAVDDTLHFKGSLPHSWRNGGAETVRFLAASSLPRAFRSALRECLREPEQPATK